MTNGEHPMTLDDRSSELTASFSETAQALFSAGNPADTLRAVVDLAVETIDGCDFASIFVVDGNTVATPVGTDSVAAGVDVVQHQAGEGPGLDAINQGGTVYAEDLADDPRWCPSGLRQPRQGCAALSRCNYPTTPVQAPPSSSTPAIRWLSGLWTGPRG